MQRSGSKLRMGGRSRGLLTFLIVGLLTVTSYQNCGAMRSNQNSGSGGPGGSVVPGAGLQTFNTVTVPVLKRYCLPCHDLPANGGSAPLTIFEYATARQLLASGGQLADNNTFMNKVQGNAHTGGNRCVSGLDQSPCAEIIKWWESEFGTAVLTRFAGRAYISSRGIVNGFAVDTGDLAASAQVRLFVDGAVGIGTEVATLSANMPGYSGYAGNHAFTFTLPAGFRNGTSHTLHAYVSATAGPQILQGTPVTFSAYTPTTAGLNFFSTTLGPALQNACGSCHNRTYNDAWDILIQPFPNAGGSPTNNLLIRKAGALESHGGGNRCGGINQGVCAQIQTWWDLEF
jgi:hypothetical protein